MSIFSSNTFHKLQQCFAGLVIMTMLASVVPATAFAQEVPPEENTSGEDGGSSSNITGGETASSDGTATDGVDGSDGASTGKETGGAGTSENPNPTDNTGTDGETGTEEDVGTEGETDSDTQDSAVDPDPDTEPDTEDSIAGEEGSETSDGTDNGGDGEAASGETDGTDGDTGAGDTTTENMNSDGTEGGDGMSGENGGVNVEEEPPDNPDPVTIISENEVADDTTPNDGEEVTGSRTVNGDLNRVEIETGKATAQAELTSDVNSGDIKSLVDPDTFGGDLDNYEFNATGTNEADVVNTASILALTGNNEATTEGGPAEVWTGDAFAALNIANVVNSTVVNSDGFLYLGNRILEPNQSLNLTDFFFPDPEGELARANDCDLLSCVAEDIFYNFSQTNTAVVTNNANLEAVTGENFVDTETSFSDIYTGDAYGGANIINVVNTNIVDSNYRFLTFNAMGDLDGDLLLPTQELFNAFFGRPNGMTQLEDAEDIHATINNTNEADVNNDVESEAETGLNFATSSADPDIMTGNAESESNILNKINQNILGGDIMHLLIRVHGSWNGEVRGLPDGLAWQWTPEGVLIYNEGAEIAPSATLPYDVDSYNAEITDFNNVTINNNVTIDSVTGKNDAIGGVSTIVTGDAFASANVMNVANTNVIGANWTYAVINIFGDFSGDIAFTDVDLTLTGSVSAPNPLGPSDILTYSYTVHNNSTSPARNVMLSQSLENASADGGESTQEIALGDLDPGESVTTQFTATVDEDIPVGTTSVRAIATVSSNEAELTPIDNGLLLTSIADVAAETDDTGTSTDPDPDDDIDDTNASTTEGNPDGTTDEDDSDDQEVNDSNTGSGGSNPTGGGGGKPKNDTKSIDRSEGNDDPNRAPFLIIKKESNVDEDEIVKAGQTVDYTITLTNNGGTAYDAVVYDSLVNPIGSVLNEQSWELGTILADEVIEIEYSTTYDFKTPSGTYTNTASIEAYRHETSKEDGDDPLKLDEAVHTIEISGVDLAIGNTGMVAYYPNGEGTLNALVTWETSKPATGQVMFSPTSARSLYNPAAPNFGYQNLSFHFNTPKTKHYMILRDLIPGVAYDYKIRSTNGTKLAVQGNYTFSTPTGVFGIALALPNGEIAQLGGQVAGASISRPTTPSTPTNPVTPASPKTAKTAYVTPTTPDPEPTPEPPVEKPDNQDNGFFGGVAKKVFGLFR